MIVVLIKKKVIKLMFFDIFLQQRDNPHFYCRQRIIDQ